ncbi:glycerophosphodiester phosphodiesterase [Planococcus sp. ISL-109]|uniref:glycerophosphodiester phosphodiesterase n=1 Tax=Planococcus sp. ISL-109 TaxID=2819166 RepID=UPI001BEC82A2|nr:glycerophosphodiester phosphodiesterase [Planococcus sp. ISL-109]MBT2581835.1 glycerophosphodiester phosphodiesterase [Planococcus sp. ISL-109]
MGKKTKIGLTAAAVGAAAWAGSKALTGPQIRPQKAILSYGHPIVLAHRGGSSLAPEHTMAAFNKSTELGAHGFEIDIRMTNDEEILVFHDEFIDRTSDSAGRVAEMTIDELRALDLGYHFVDENGEHSYRGKGETVVLLRDLLENFPQMHINIDIKDAPDTYEGSLIPSKLWRLIESLEAQDRVVVTSFFDEQIDRFNLYAQNRVALGAGENEVRKAFASFNSQFGHLYAPRADVFQLPVKHSVFRLDSPRFIAFLERLNIPVHYWVIDEKDAMEKLIAAGAKGIITSRPDIAIKLISAVEENRK